ncbi:hypothetical protein ACO0LO_03820 [Undibacterium sp. TJN25]|uniref:hypothetical protein n=1 Tax=Undibacterium sp. TJN25 TaxID=3413056 RepID=UPI003BF20E3A
MIRKYKIAKIAVLALVGLAVVPWVVMSLWNWLMPALFTGVHTIDYLRALGLLALCRILFGGFRGHGGGWRRHRHMQQRWEQMSNEEREKFQQGMMGFRGRGRDQS